MKTLSFVLTCLISTVALAQAQSVINSAHNLSATGPGSIRASNEQEVCIFCHTPHNASPVQPLWNRSVPVSAYTPYRSSSLQASPGQPTGSSKLCLSCHDGTIALGSVMSRGQAIPMAGGITTLPPGSKGNLGTDLSDDHPISFKYNSELASKGTRLKNPAELPPSVRMDARSELQCSTCHDPHDNSFGKFLVMDNSNSQLCRSCHNTNQTNVMSHESCNSCHQPHSAPSGAYLLKGPTVGDTCNGCHNGTVAGAANIAGEMNKYARHDTTPVVDRPVRNVNDVTCNDCHSSHTMTTAVASAPHLPGRFGKINGVDLSGNATPAAQFEYEVCFKCHADQNAVQPKISRQVAQANLRLKFEPNAVSFHPVAAAGKNTNVPSLKPGLTTASQIYCTDCHSSDTSKTAGGTGPAGPHGSAHASLLKANYTTADNTAETEQAYALCYSCHERTSVLGDQSFTKHRLHVVDKQTPCSACHDAHGVPSAQGTAEGNKALMNFDLSIVQPDPVTNRREFRSTGVNKGECYLNCHGVAHSPKAY